MLEFLKNDNERWIVCRESGIHIGYIKNETKAFYPYRQIMYNYHEIKEIIIYLRKLNAKGPKLKVFLDTSTREVYDELLTRLGEIKENEKITFESYIFRLDLTYLEQIDVILKECNLLQFCWKRVGF